MVESRECVLGTDRKTKAECLQKRATHRQDEYDVEAIYITAQPNAQVTPKYPLRKREQCATNPQSLR